MTVAEVIAGLFSMHSWVLADREGPICRAEPQQPGDPAEYEAFLAALNPRDAEKRATAMEMFIACYPDSVTGRRCL